MASRPEVVITGLGMISPLGIGSQAVWDSLLAQRSGVRRIRRFPTTGLPVDFGAEVPPFDVSVYVAHRKSLKVMSVDIKFAVAAASLACHEAELTPGSYLPERLGVEFGAHTTESELHELKAAYRVCLEEGRFCFQRWGRKALPEFFPLWMLKYLPNMAACHIGINHNAQGPSNTMVQGEISTLLSIAEAVRTIERNHADVMIAGGTGSRIHPKMMAAALKSQQIARSRESPQQACRPFDAQRSGLVFGEGAAALVLERKSYALARKAPILARVLGYGSGTARELDLAIAVAIRSALRDARLTPAEIGHISANASGTTDGDRAEAQAIRRVFERPIPVIALKSYFGNLGAGAGALELGGSLLALEHGTLPASLNYEHPDPACPIHVVAGEARPITEPTAMVLSCTPAGQAAALIVRREAEVSDEGGYYAS